MPRTARSIALRLVLVLGYAATVAGLGACSLLPPGTVPTSVDTPLVSYDARGGLCPEGECAFHAAIYPDGRVTRSDGLAQVVDEPTLRRLLAEIGTADYRAILAVPFTGLCPTAYDGQEQVYTFHGAVEPIVIASCTTAVDVGRAPFRTIQEILFGPGG